MMTENNVDIQKALAYYTNLKSTQKIYCCSDRGKERRRIASRTYYNKMKEIDPEFLKKNNELAKLRYQRKKEKLLEEVSTEK
jgi:hypothetical protein